MSFSKSRLLFLTFLLLLSHAGPLRAQLTTQTGFTATQLANHLAGPNITVSNATLTGPGQGSGKFVANNTNLGMNSGVILATGNIANAIGPNNDQGRTTDFNAPGSALLQPIAGTQTFDAVQLAFDFTVESDEISFNYVFASEEYLEFVNAGFNDVFGFFISGPGIVGQENIALVPNTAIPTSIDNINTQSYWQYFVDNDNGTSIQYDGFTANLVARRKNLIPCSTYRLTLVITDAGDGAFDSGVFLEENSLVQGTVSAITQTASGDSVAVEGCLDARFTFNINQPLPYNLTIPLDIGGNAINGVDYSYIDSVIVIPAGQTSADIIVHAAADGITEGLESVLISFQTSACASYDTVRLYIQDNVSITYSTTGNNPTCAGASNGSIQVNMTGGTPPFQILVNGTDTITGTTIPNLPAGTYVIDVLDGNGCGAQDLVIGGQFNAGTTFLPDGHGAIYTSTINIAGFPASATLTNVNMLNFVCLNMEHSFMGDLEMRLYAPNGTFITLKERPGGGVCNLGEPVAVGHVDANSNDLTPGIGYDYCFNNNPIYGTMVSESNNYNYTYTTQTGSVQSDRYLPAGSYEPYEPFSGLLGVPLNGNWQIWIKDHRPNDNGYLFNWAISLSTGQSGDTVVLVDPPAIGLTAAVTAAGCGQNNGAVNISVSGSTSYNYAWSNGPTTQDINNVGAGTYTVTVTAANGCQRDSTFIVPNSGTPPNVVATTTQVTCPGGTNGSVNLAVTGGTSPYTYLWSTGATTQNLTNRPAGTYFVTVTGANSCRRIVQAVITEIPGMTVAAVETDETCGNQNGSIDLTVSAGTGPYTYRWNNNSTTEDRTLLAAGTYTVTVTDANSCTVVRAYSLTNIVGNCFVPCNLSMGTPTLVNETCGSANGSITISTSGGVQPFSYAWSNGAATQNLTNVQAGTYSVTVTDVNNCTTTGSWTLTNQTNSLAIGSLNVTNEVCGNGAGAINLTATGGVQPFTYAWSNGATTQNLSGLHAGSFSVTVTDASGCRVNGTATVQNQTGGLAQTYGNAVSGTCGSGQLGSIDITIGGGNPPYSYAWSNGATSQDLVNLPNGTYTCTVTDASGCRLTTPAYTIANGGSNLTVSIVLQNDEVCGNGQGRIKVAGLNGSSPYTYLWNTGATTDDLTGLSAGTYSVTVTGSNGCTATSGNITIANSAGNLNPGTMFVVNEVCGNHQGYVRVTPINGTSPFTYLWNTGSTSNDLNGVGAGTYTCTVTDANGCTASVSGAVTNDPGTLAISNIVATDEACGNGVGALDLIPAGGTAPLTYAWSNGGSTQDLTGLHAGTFTVTITDAGGCQVQGNGTVNNQANGLNVTHTLTAPSCGNNNGAVDLTVTGGTTPYTYTWSNGTTGQDALLLAPGTYACTVTDAANCSWVAGPFTLNNSAGTLNATITQVTNETCTNAAGAVNLTVSGATGNVTYLWSNSATTQDLAGVSAGTYTVTVTDAGGCTTTTTATVQNNPGTLSATPIITDEQCNNNAGAINLTVSGNSGALTYLWSSGQTSQNITGLSSGSFSVTVTDAASCRVVLGPLTVSDNPGNMSLSSFLITDESCGNGQGSITTNIIGAANPVTYLWSNGAVTDDIINLSSGTYTVTATDANGCRLTASGSVHNDPGNLAVSSGTVTDASCGNSNGGIDIVPTGGSGTYTYLWNNGATSQDLTNVAAGTYTLLLQDNAGCSASYSATVNDPGNTLQITGTSVQPALCGNNTGSVSVSTSGGGAPLSYQWSNGAITSSISNLAPGTYSVTVTDANGCFRTSLATVVNSGGALNGTLTPTAASCGNNNGAINLTPQGGSMPYTYAWSSGQTTQDLNNIAAGNYTVTVTDINGCSTSLSTTVNNGSTMSLASSAATNETCGDGTGAVTLTVSGGSTPYTYLWSNGATTQNLSGLHAGTYSVTITDAAGCDFTPAAFTVTNNTGTLQAAGQASDETCGNANGGVSLTVAGGTAPVTYLWSNGATSQNLTGVSAGTYTVTVTDGTGCSLSQTFTVQNTNNGLFANGNITQPDCNQSNGEITLFVNGGTPGYTYLWSNGATTSTITGIGSGAFTVTVTDAQGCETTSSFNVTNAAANIQMTVQVFDDFCGNGQGGIFVNVSTPGSYTYALDGGTATTNNFFNAVTGQHTVTIFDGQGCQKDTVVNVPGQPAPAINGNVVNASCATCADGDVILTVTGGNPPYFFQWSNGAFTQNLNNVLPGTYTVDIQDQFGCQYTATFTISFSTATDPQPASWEFNVFPNPNQGNFQVDLSMPSEENVKIEVYSMVGVKVYETELGHVLSTSHAVSLHDFSDGVYVLRVTAGETVLNRKITVTR